MPCAAAFVVKRVGLRVNAEHAFINFDQRRRLVGRERHAMSDKLQLFDFLQHRYRSSLSLWERVRVRALAGKKINKIDPPCSAPQLRPSPQPSPKREREHQALTPLRKTSMTTSAMGSSL